MKLNGKLNEVSVNTDIYSCIAHVQTATDKAIKTLVEAKGL